MSKIIEITHIESSEKVTQYLQLTDSEIENFIDTVMRCLTNNQHLNFSYGTKSYLRDRSVIIIPNQLLTKSVIRVKA